MKPLSELVHNIQRKEFPVSVYAKKGTSTGFLLYKLLPVINSPVLVVCDNEKTCNAIYDDLTFFLPSVYKIPSLGVPAYGKIAPSIDILSERISTYYRALNNERAVFVSTIKALIEPAIPPAVLKEHYEYIVQGEDLSFERLRRKLPKIGYQAVESVEMPGEYAIKGGVLDVFSPYNDLPVRIEFFGDTVESLRAFRTDNQRSVEMIKEGIILPVRDYVFDSENIEKGLHNLKLFCDEHDVAKKTRDEISEKIQKEIYLAGIEFLLPALYGEQTTGLCYFKDIKKCLLSPDDIRREFKTIRDTINADHEFHEQRKELVLPPEKIFNMNALSEIEDNVVLRLENFNIEGQTLELDCEENTDIIIRSKTESVSEKKKAVHPLEHFKKIYTEKSPSFKTAIITSKKNQAAKIQELLSFYDVQVSGALQSFDDFYRTARTGDLYLITGRPLNGFRIYSENIWIITEEEIFGIAEKKKESPKKELAAFISSLYELKENDFVVHIDHGIGIYRGLKQVKVLEQTGEFVEIEYADNGKLFVPVAKINLLQKYIASEDYAAKVDRLGEKRWNKAKKKVKDDLVKTAEEIIKIEAMRRMNQGHGFTVNRLGLEEFSASFDYEETEDQTRAIEQVVQDMESPKPMDRVICGDVGYGKTEVAVRAAFVAVSENKQACLIAPTTILAEQHYEVFKQRLEPFGVKVGLLSRFVDIKEQKKAIEKIKKNELSVIIGTHRLLGKDVAFHDLGLLIIDEEQKFGVTHKERLKKMRATVDILTLTATPIPRTLHLSLSGLKDISLIATPPPGRLSIRTYIVKFSDDIIKEALEREVQRGGQVFFVHNRIKSIFAMKRHLSDLFGQYSIGVAHGRMEEEELKEVMHDFKRGKYQILLSTAIIESGLDLPNVNTIIVNRADKFGLADLYQLRGRVGRSNKRAYAYFMVPSFEIITRDAQKRLKALQELEELGSGFRLAIHDLEIRGAGDVLGKKQSGHINEVGLELYMQLLEETIREIRYKQGNVQEKIKIDVEVKLPFPAYIPETYMPSMRERLDFYKKIMAAESSDVLTEIEDELIDRFGPAPQELKNFIYQEWLELELEKKGIRNCYLANEQIVIVFDKNYIPPQTVLLAVVKKHRSIRYLPPEKIYIDITGKSRDLAEIKKILHGFLESVTISG